LLSVEEVWVRAPEILLALMPVRVLGHRVPVLLGAELHHHQLVPLGHTDVGARIEASGLDLTLAGRLRPGRIVDILLSGGWHGSLMRHGGDVHPDLWTQLIEGKVDARLGLMGPVFGSGLAHRIDLGISYRLAHQSSSSSWSGPLAGLEPAAPPAHVVGLFLASALVASRGEVLSLRAGGWLLPAADEPLLALVSLDLALRAGPFGLVAHVDLPSDDWRPSLGRTSMRLAGPGVSLTLEHLYVARPDATSLDLDVWMATRLGVVAAARRVHDVHAAVAGIELPLIAGLSLGGRVGLDLATRAGAWIEAALVYSHPCRCLSVGLVVLKRSAVPSPDVLFTLSL
jgi:hypothetical protein